MNADLRERHPRPTLARSSFWVIDGPVPFQWDLDTSAGRADWRSGDVDFAQRITLPFAPETTRSGIAESHLVGRLWYRLDIPAEAAAPAREPGMSLLLHMEGVFGRARLWLNGSQVGTTTSSYSCETFDIGSVLRTDGPDTLVIEVDVDHADLSRPRGKQAWRPDPHGIWYGRSSGIWRDVWLEVVPRQHVAAVSFITDLDSGSIGVDVQLSRPVVAGTALTTELRHDGRTLCSVTSSLDNRSARVILQVPGLQNEHEHGGVLWSPQTPHLLDVSMELVTPGGPTDSVDSYVGVREVAVRGDRFTLNHRPEYFNGVLEQYYWRDSHFTAPSEEDRRAEVEIIKSLGFNGVRIHQVSPDPRFLYWCDRLGLMVWAELPSAYRFDAAAVVNLTHEWMGLLRQCSAHPSVVTWVPFNESWGVGAVERRPDQQALVSSLVQIAKALDPTRPVVSNDGWEHVSSDILGYHDYTQDADALAARFRDTSWIAYASRRYGVAGRTGVVSAQQDPGAPLMVSEFGGVSHDHRELDESWGYASVDSPEELLQRLTVLVSAIRSVPRLAGSCYTQLTDTLQETNGILDENRRPKAARDLLREIFELPI